MNVVNELRKDVIEGLFKTNTFDKAFGIWNGQIIHHVGKLPTAESILSLASILRDVFKSTGVSGRDQKTLSAGGAAWEALVCYYLNLCLIGSNSVVIKKTSMVPSSIRKAMTVSYGNTPANTESDLICITLPDINDVRLDLKKVPLIRKETPNQRFEMIANENFDNLRIAVIQCKTNWNDNAQIPMLWDMIYNVEEFMDDDRISVGIDNKHLNKKNFTYSFATVPSNELKLFKTNTLAVKRVASMSGGNYWGLDTKTGVAKSLREIFTKAKIGPKNGRGISDSLTSNIPSLNSDYSYFKLK